MALFLGSSEVPAWAGAREVRLLGSAGERDGRAGHWAALGPPGPSGLAEVILAARHAGQRLDPPSELPMSVDLWVPGAGEQPGDPVDLDRIDRVGVGELYGGRRLM